MSHRYARPVETLIDQGRKPDDPHNRVLDRVEVLIIGSGYGGSIAAQNLAGLRKDGGLGAPVRVMVLERGKEYVPGEFPNQLGDLPGHVRFQRPEDDKITGNTDALFDLRIGEDLDVLVGSGLGGTSLINAAVAMEPDPHIFQEDKGWPKGFAPPRPEEYEHIRKQLGVSTDTGTDTGNGVPLRKYQAFAELTRAVGLDPQPAPSAITRAPEGDPDKPPPLNSAGIRQAPCTNCGNCITGCNVGAKNTLTMNVIPQAYQQGVEFITGATVFEVAKCDMAQDRRYTVSLKPTKSLELERDAPPFQIQADVVILAAGALGSTEILARSSLETSPMLGRKFSTNGDALVMTYGQRSTVGAMGTPRYDARSEVGPTITARATHHHRKRERTWLERLLPSRTDPNSVGMSFTLEDGTVPAALVKLYGELLTTGAQLHRLADNRLPGYFKQRANRDLDPLAVHRDILDHGQLLLVMSEDGADMRLGFGKHAELATDGQAKQDRGLRSLFPAWEPKSQADNGARGEEPGVQTGDAERASRDDSNAQLGRVLDLLATQNRKRSVGKGQVVPNPLLRPVPPNATEVLSGRSPGGRRLTVHPLGGCRMGDDPSKGVVDVNGCVFQPDGSPHDGLYVMDGSVVPSALATNPLLTISVIADRWSKALAEQEQWRADPGTAKRPLPAEVRVARRVPEPDDTVELRLREQLFGRMQGSHARLSKVWPDGLRLLGHDGAILQIRLAPFDPHSFFAHQSERRGRRPAGLEAEVTLLENPLTEHVSRSVRRYGPPGGLRELATGRGHITLLERDLACGPVVSLARTLLALVAYVARRRIRLTGLDPWRFLKVARMHAEYRVFRYRFELDAGDVKITLKGDKRVALRPFHPQLWDSLVSFRPTLTVRRGARRFRGRMHLGVDVKYLLEDGAPQMTRSATLPDTAVASLGLVTMFARTALESSFWAFGAPDYPAEAIVRNLGPRRLRGHAGIAPRVYPLHDHLELTRYPGRTPGCPVVLMIHGLAQGSLIFSNDHMSHNMATDFWRQGFDVWLVDYRLSHSLRDRALRAARAEEDARDQAQVRAAKDAGAPVPPRPKKKVALAGDIWECPEGIDPIGLEDIPEAIAHARKVLAEERGGAPKLFVFAHCVGAVGVQMAILAGKLPAAQLAAVCFNAIHPWVIPSPSNTIRAKIAAFTGMEETPMELDPVIPSEAEVSAAATLSDRLAFSMARYAEGRTDRHAFAPFSREFSSAICDRMTSLYGRMWHHQNLEHALMENWADIVGEAPLRVLVHLYYMVDKERLLDHDGLNAYLTEDSLRAHWTGIPTLFMHGDASEVFNPQSATKSATRLRQVLASGGDTEQMIYAARLEGYGHMDPILARDAAGRSYRTVRHFFEFASRFHATGQLPNERQLRSAGLVEPDPRVLDSATDVQDRLKIVAGPVLRAAWLHQRDGERPSVRMRYWFECWEMSTSGERTVEILPAPVASFDEAGQPVPAPRSSRYHWFDCDAGPAPARVFPTLRVRCSTLPGCTWTRTDLASNPPWVERLQQRGEGKAVRDFNFVVASCRYPGLPVETSASDAIFKPIGDMVYDPSEAIDLLFLIGDNIYADATADLFANPSNVQERFSKQYRDAFQSELASRVLGSLPVHFAIDDHEIHDNWSGDPPVEAPAGEDAGAVEREPHSRAWHALNQAERYLGHGRQRQPIGAARGTSGRFWYALDGDGECGCPAFVMDTRAERTSRVAHDAPHMFGQAQLAALETWLRAAQQQHPERPKFIFAGQTAVPYARHYHHHPATQRLGEGFAGYPNSFDDFAHAILAAGAERVVLLGGDLHLSCCAHLTLTAKDGGQTAKLIQLVSSGLYAPMPFANTNPDDHDWDVLQQIDLPRHRIEYEASLLSAAPSQFMRVGAVSDGQQWHLELDVRGPSGAPLLDPTGRALQRVVLDL